MRLISCENCGGVFDENILDSPVNLYKDNGNDGCEIYDTKAVWISRNYKPFVTCRACGGKIIKEP